MAIGRRQVAAVLTYMRNTWGRQRPPFPPTTSRAKDHNWPRDRTSRLVEILVLSAKTKGSLTLAVAGN